MPVEELYVIMDDWYGRGVISASDRASLKAEYLLEMGVSTCTVCPNFWQNVQIHFRLKLKAQNLTVMSQQKYLIDGGSLMLPGENTIYVSEIVGGNANGNVLLTDALAADILKKYPHLDKTIVENPEYVAPKKKDDAPVAKTAEPVKEAPLPDKDKK